MSAVSPGSVVRDAYSPVPELNLLKEFLERSGDHLSVIGFELFDWDDDLDWFCGAAPDTYLDRLIPFAYATSSGSYYALWRCDDRPDLAALPVVFFGDEGDLCIEAGDLRELFQLLGADPDPEELDDYFDLDAPQDRADRERFDVTLAEYREWLLREFGLAPLDSRDAVDEQRADAYALRFAHWIAEFADEGLLNHATRALGVDISAEG
ncbi:hypothetical protein [Streptomyces cavernicola]|uniref:SMI1/KNR4 family protein n=1 Tax=Streptomyces cavernicola TaxID=3043613 RepID=A0ABT6SGV7_9ACTN|nr:hypothetical protein [Streptomyces sp. B-S-A6]MDI3406897.1 hypothetical protein [Streptomyces sp. B-S-A6]